MVAVGGAKGGGGESGGFYAGYNGGGGAGWIGDGGTYLFGSGNGQGGRGSAGGFGGGAYMSAGGLGGGGGGGGGYSGGAGGIGKGQWSSHSNGGGGGGSFYASGVHVAFMSHGYDQQDGFVRFGAHHGHRPYSLGVNEYTVANTGSLYFRLYGAAGGDTGSAHGGLGVKIAGFLPVTAGERVYFLEGQVGSNGSSASGAGGGGGSFIWMNAALGAPEPSLWLMLEVGVLGIGFALRRHRARMRKLSGPMAA